MSIYKQLTTADTVITPFKVNKLFTLYSSGSTGFIDNNVDIFIGRNITSSLFQPNAEIKTGFINEEYERLIYDSVKHLYYSNFITNSFGDNVPTSSVIPNQFITSSLDITGNSLTSTNNYNYLSSTLTASRSLPTGSNEILGVISIPSNLYGEYIKPGTFKFSKGIAEINDDAEGNLEFFGKNIGNIIYEHGLAIITAQTVSLDSLYTLASYSIDLYGYSSSLEIFLTGSDLTCSFESVLTKYEYQLNCQLRESDYNFSQNPSIISSSNGQVYDFATGSYFDPFITTIGLYNEHYDLLAVGKLGQPLPKSHINDTNIILNLDMF